MKSKRILLFGIISIIFLGIIYICAFTIHDRYKKELMAQEQMIIGNILKKHPELEAELITIIFSQSENKDLGETFLETYGIDLESYDYMHSILQQKEKTVLTLMLLFSAILIFFIYMYIHNFQKDQKEIKQVTNYLNHILSGDYSLSIHEYNEGKISTLKNDIYKITILLREQEAYSKNEKKHLERVLSDISHQLKTPLTSMYVINDILENDDIEEKKKKEMLHKNRSQLKRIEWLVSALLKLSRLDSGVVVMQPHIIGVRKLIEQALEPLRIPIELKEQNLKITGDEKLTASLDSAWTIEAFVNLIKNAHEHTPNKGTIQIRYTDNPLYIVFQIEDNGCGIAQADLPFIFDRFYTGTTSSKESIGIGLNMAKTIIQKQNGMITVESTLEKGTIFTIKFYKNII